jgi:hypothetical protein
MGTKFWEVVCDENGIGGDGDNCGDNDTQLDRNHGASGGKHLPLRCSSTSSPARSALRARRRLASSSARATS